MQVILLERMQNLGSLGEEVNVRPGYARNFLIPHGKAVAATAANRSEFEARRTELERHEAEVVGTAQARADRLAGVEITVERKSADEGRLFGSVTVADVAEAISEAAGITVDRGEIRLPVESIRQTGEYTVGVHLHADVDAEVLLKVEAEEV